MSIRSAFRSVFTAVVFLLMLPAAVLAQGTIAGVVRDSSGAVLPGVTVEASSPVLIEKMRTVTTNETGQYRIVDLRPGTYALTFTLAGFNTTKREGVELTGTFTATVNIDLRVGALEETVTVISQTAAVDLQSTTKQQVLNKQVIDSLPTGRLYANLAVLVPGVTASGQDVGGSRGDIMATISAHGSRAQDTRIMVNGLNISTLQAGGQAPGMQSLNMSQIAEMTVDTSAASAELSTGGPRVNLIPRDGGNTFAGSFYANLATHSMQGDNLTDRLKALGLATPDSIKRVGEVTPAFGGPIKKDRLWFFWSGRYAVADTYAAGMFENKNAFNPALWTFDPDSSKPAFNASVWKSTGLRTTFQATPKNKFAFQWDQHDRCSCPFFISATRAPEAAADRRSPQQRLLNTQWTSPITNKLLVEVVALHRTERWGDMNLQPLGSLDDPVKLAAYPQMIPVTEQSSGLIYRSFTSFTNTFVPNYAYRGTVTYVTGTHEVKTGVNDTWGYLEQLTTSFQPISYRVNNGVPNQLALNDFPTRPKSDEHHDFGIFVQDKWKLSRLTLTGGFRFDAFRTGFPAQQLGPSPLNPTRNISFPASDNLSWNDITPRSGAVYDVRGDGKSAVRVSLNKYLRGQTLNALGSSPNPINALSTTTTRNWNDANRDFVPQCNLRNPLADGECGPMANSTFGTLVPGATFDPDLLTGWNHRDFNWEFSTALQHQLASRVFVDVGFYRRWFGNFAVTDNTLVTAADYSPFSITAPVDSRLPDGGGNVISGLFDLNPNKVGQVNNFNTLSNKYGKQTEHWNGVDVTINMRLPSGVMVQGGTSTGRTTSDSCDIRAKLPESAPTNPYCHVVGKFLTQAKLLAVYTIPRVDVLVSGTWQSLPGSLTSATFNATNAVVQPSLGRPLSGGAANVPVNLVEPGAMYGERLNQIDLRFGKILRVARVRASLNLDVYNALNSDTVLTLNNNYATWLRPTGILQARFAKVTAQLDF